MRLKSMAQARKTLTILPRWRVYCGEDIAVGPGKVELLAHVKNSGSLVEAAKAMDMSYMRAWLLVKTMNRCFKEPLIILTRGGKRGGGAMLTATGERALGLYEQLEKDSLSGTKSIQNQLIRLLKK
jgi:molybdate transport system regulatory protein